MLTPGPPHVGPGLLGHPSQDVPRLPGQLTVEALVERRGSPIEPRVLTTPKLEAPDAGRLGALARRVVQGALQLSGPCDGAPVDGVRHGDPGARAHEAAALGQGQHPRQLVFAVDRHQGALEVAEASTRGLQPAATVEHGPARTLQDEVVPVLEVPRLDGADAERGSAHSSCTPSTRYSRTLRACV